MKHILLSIALLATTLPLFAQQTSIQGFMDKHKQEPAFSYAFMSKDLFDIAMQTDSDDAGWKKLHQVIKNIGCLSVLAADSIENGQALYKEAIVAVPLDDFDELLTVQDGNDRVKIWAKEADKVVTDLVLLAGTKHEFVLIAFAGNLELDNITALTGMFNAASMEQLAKTSQAMSATFSISPNPGNGLFDLTFSSPDDSPQQVMVLDQNGRQLSILNLSTEATQSLNLTELPAGIYWLQLKTTAGKIGVRQIQIVK